MRKDKDILLQQRDQAKEDLIGCHRQLNLLQVRFQEHQKKNQVELGLLESIKEKEVLFTLFVYKLYSPIIFYYKV